MTDRSPEILAGLVRALSDVDAFSRAILQRPLRPYQFEVARAILRSVEDQAGRTFTVMFPRQTGKNETSAQLEAFLLTRHQATGGSIVKTAPTFRPQIVNSITRLTQLLDNALTRKRFSMRWGYQLTIGRAVMLFFSAAPTANVVGGTASLLLECDEAQDVDALKWGKEFVPMGATGNATKVLWGTPWSTDDLLAQSIAEARLAERRDGFRRHFEVDWQTVAAANPAYGRHVEAEIARLGADHPIIRTQYLLQTMARAGRLLTAAQVDALRGDHPPELAPLPRAAYVAAIDVAGQDEEDPDGALVRVNPKRDSTVLAIARVQEPRVAVSAAGGIVEPQLRVVRLYAWRGTPHRQVYPLALQLVQSVWRCRSVVVDATGVGGGLAAFLGAALGPQVVTPWHYTAATKSRLAYGLLEAVNAGRLTVYAESPDDVDANEARRELLAQCEAAEYSLRANQVMAFAVPEQRGHDDHLNALALLTQTVQVGAARAAVGHQARRELHRPFGDDRPSRR